jgi:hypothetical protein
MARELRAVNVGCGEIERILPGVGVGELGLCVQVSEARC